MRLIQKQTLLRKSFKMMVTILFGTLFMVCACTVKRITAEESSLRYENYPCDSIVLPEKCLEYSALDYTDVAIDGSTVPHVPINQIKGPCFDLLFDLDVINEWDLHRNSDEWKAYTPYTWDYNHKDYVKQRKEGTELFYMGELKLSESFDSHLILILRSVPIFELIPIDSPEREPKRRLLGDVFLINVANNAIVSITKACSYDVDDGAPAESYIFTEQKGKVFIQKDINEMYNEIDKSISIVKFTYDETGRLKVRKSIRKTYMEEWDKDFADD